MPLPYLRLDDCREVADSRFNWRALYFICRHFFFFPESRWAVFAISRLRRRVNIYRRLRLGFGECRRAPPRGSRRMSLNGAPGSGFAYVYAIITSGHYRGRARCLSDAESRGKTALDAPSSGRDGHISARHWMICRGRGGHRRRRARRGVHRAPSTLPPLTGHETASAPRLLKFRDVI